MSADGLITISSAFGPEETVARLEAEIRANGMTVFARIDHAAGAAEAGLPLRRTDLVIFGGRTRCRQAWEIPHSRPSSKRTKSCSF